MAGFVHDPAHAAESSFAADLEAARSADADAFGRLWRATHPMLIRYLRVVAGDLADDVASEAWLKAIRGLDGFRGDESGFRAWMVTIARNHLREIQRRAARRGELLIAGPVEGPDETLQRDVADIVLERLDTAAALRLVASLPADQAEMVALRVLIGLDVAEVAKIVGRNPGAVRVAVHRGLRRLAERLAAGGPAHSREGRREVAGERA
jgi:RNA polymerase sigma-70 factor (ECF subfamily)